ncbi:MAG: beta-propeller domain-containing protein [Candidatus Peribacteria bacterium]|nr:MAG: beta-propeller domain-containing protein [Candidatus Peribacteria bacterium]
MAGSASDTSAVANESSIQSSTNDYSTTNIQKVGVDEPDLYKTDGDILYYYNNTDHMVYLIQSPLDRANQTITLSDMQILAQIKIPDTLQSSNLYVYDDELIIIGSRRKENPRRRGWFDGSSTTFVARYDVSSSTSSTLINYTEYDGYLLDSRLSLTDGTLIVMTTVSPSWYSIWEDDVIADDEMVLPRTVSITPTATSWESNVTSIDCAQTFLLLPSDDTLEQIGDWPSFTTVHTVDLATDTTSDYATFGSAGQVHVSQDHIYLAQNIWLPQGQYSCPADARCAMPLIWGGNNSTLIHGFKRDGIQVSYQ